MLNNEFLSYQDKRVVPASGDNCDPIGRIVFHDAPRKEDVESQLIVDDADSLVEIDRGVVVAGNVPSSCVRDDRLQIGQVFLFLSAAGRAGTAETVDLHARVVEPPVVRHFLIQRRSTELSQLHIVNYGRVSNSWPASIASFIPTTGKRA